MGQKATDFQLCSVLGIFRIRSNDHDWCTQIHPTLTLYSTITIHSYCISIMVHIVQIAMTNKINNFNSAHHDFQNKEII